MQKQRQKKTPPLRRVDTVTPYQALALIEAMRMDLLLQQVAVRAALLQHRTLKLTIPIPNSLVFPLQDWYHSAGAPGSGHEDSDGDMARPSREIDPSFPRGRLRRRPLHLNRLASKLRCHPVGGGS